MTLVFILVGKPQIFDFDKNKSSLITNDRVLASELQNQIRDPRSDSNINFTLNLDNGYVYKVLKKGVIYFMKKQLIK
jgi:hypothetical protein